MNPVSAVYAVPFAFTAIPLKYICVPAGNPVTGSVNAPVANNPVSETLVPAQALNPCIVFQQNPRSVIADHQLLVIVAPKIPVAAYTPVAYAPVIIGSNALFTVVNFRLDDHVNPGYALPAKSLNAPFATSI